MDYDYLYDSRYCRLCAEKHRNGYRLFDDNESDEDLSVLINRCLPLKVRDDGRYPRSICPGCRLQIEATMQFFNLLIAGQKKLRALYQEEVLNKPKPRRTLSDLASVDTEVELNEACLYNDHKLCDEIAGQDKPKRKRGRPPKCPAPVEEPNLSPEEVPEPEPIDPSDTGRRKRRIKIPFRFQQAVQGKELERIYLEKGVIDKHDMMYGGNDRDEVFASSYARDEQKDVIGYLKGNDGSNLGDLITVNKQAVTKDSQSKRVTKFVCGICNKGFQQKCRFLEHRVPHHDVLYECKRCLETFAERIQLMGHQSESGHTGEGIIEDLSNFDASHCTVGEKHDHVEDLTDGNESKSEVAASPNSQDCRSPVEECQEQTRHDSEASTNKSGKYFCNVCDRRFNHPSSVIYHRESVHNKGRRFACSKCKKVFKHKQLLQRHQLVHSSARPFVCDKCNRTFKTRGNLLNHQTTHTELRKFVCTLCKQSFAYKTSLTLHMRWHAGWKPFKCQICLKAFTQKGNLQEHLRIHTGERPFNCATCGRKFKTSSQCKMHMKRHTVDRPYKCEQCLKTFINAALFRTHQRRHAHIKPFQCNFCTKSFVEMWALRKHTRSHTGEKPYKCEICDKRFADCSNMRKHEKNHHQMGDHVELEEVRGAVSDGDDGQAVNELEVEAENEVAIDINWQNAEYEMPDFIETDDGGKLIFICLNDAGTETTVMGVNAIETELVEDLQEYGDEKGANALIVASIASENEDVLEDTNLAVNSEIMFEIVSDEVSGAQLLELE